MIDSIAFFNSWPAKPLLPLAALVVMELIQNMLTIG
jgi:hypothetical protein